MFTHTCLLPKYLYQHVSTPRYILNITSTVMTSSYVYFDISTKYQNIEKILYVNILSIGKYFYILGLGHIEGI